MHTINNNAKCNQDSLSEKKQASSDHHDETPMSGLVMWRPGESFQICYRSRVMFVVVAGLMALFALGCLQYDAKKSFIMPTEAAAAAARLNEQDIMMMATASSRRATINAAAKYGGNSIWADLDGWRRNKRDIEDRIVLASRRAGIKQKTAGKGDEEFEVDDGNEDAWVHDGVDDIHIDPETKKAASELNQDEATIDAEYEPHGGNGNGGDGQESEAQPIANRTRITTIQEVIPINTDELDSSGGGGRPGQSIQMVGSAASPHSVGPLLPASYLTLGQVQQLMNTQRREDNDDDDQEEAEEEAQQPQSAAEESRRRRRRRAVSIVHRVI